MDPSLLGFQLRMGWGVSPCRAVVKHKLGPVAWLRYVEKMLNRAFLLLEVSPQLSGRAQAAGTGALWRAGYMLGVGAWLRHIFPLNGAVHALWTALLVPCCRCRYLQP